MKHDLLTDLKTKKILLVGLGLTGLSCARFFDQHGIAYSVTDSRPNPAGRKDLLKLNPVVDLDLGGFNEVNFLAADLLVVSPGVSLNEPVIQKAVQNGVEITGDVDIFCQLVDKPIIAISGSNGKSTLTQLVSDMLNSAGCKALPGGNIGVPVLDLLSQPDPDYYVLELSSFQLETTRHLHNHIACLLNITEDHMDRYETFTDYVSAKAQILEHARKVIFNADDEVVTGLADNISSEKRVAISSTSSNADYYLKNTAQQGKATTMLMHGEVALVNANELAIKGRHNYFNVLMALAVADIVKINIDDVLPTVKSFSGLAHRCEYVTGVDGVTWINDSKATNTGATIAALNGFKDKKLILLLGGQAKGQDFTVLKTALGENVKHVIVYGEDRQSLKACLSDTVDVIECDRLQQAVIKANQSAVQGDLVLLSPACASFDEFENYMQRGEMFVRYVHGMEAEQ